MRTAHYMITKEELTDIPSARPVNSLPGVREIRDIMIGPHNLNVAIVTGTKNIRTVVDKVLAGDKTFQFIEVMACPGGCIGGGGGPKWANLDSKLLMKRIAATHVLDKSNAIRQSHNNPAVAALFDHLKSSSDSHILHTHYTDRTSEVKGKAEQPFGAQLETTPLSQPGEE